MDYGRVFRRVLALSLLWCLAMTNGYAAQVADEARSSVLFLNPGKVQESFWGDVDGMMSAAAADLGLQLEVFHAEREHYRMAEKLSFPIVTG